MDLTGFHLVLDPGRNARAIREALAKPTEREAKNKRTVGRLFDPKNLLENRFCWLEEESAESHFIGNDCGNERKWNEIEIRPSVP